MNDFHGRCARAERALEQSSSVSLMRKKGKLRVMTNPNRRGSTPQPSLRSVLQQGGAIQIVGGVRPAPKPAEPDDWQFMLKFERGEKIYDPTEEHIISGITSLRVVEGDSYCILDRRSAGYVQAMCGVNGLHVEWCVVPNGNWKASVHFKAGHHQPPKGKVNCTKAKYIVSGFDNELLNRDDARVIFLALRRGQAMPSAYAWRQMTLEEMR